jgi:DNA-binding transcriptional MerR regulator
MIQNLYDDKYVDTIAVISAAKMAGLNMQEVGEGLDKAGHLQEKVWDWKEQVYAGIRKLNPDFVDYQAITKHISQLDRISDELRSELQAALVSVKAKDMKRWEKKALKELDMLKRRARSIYSK